MTQKNNTIKKTTSNAIKKEAQNSSSDTSNQGVSDLDNAAARQIAETTPSEEITNFGFNSMNLSRTVLRALNDVGYETPTSIQSLIIPHILAGKDVVGQAQTGTGKTAAFALPLLSSIDLRNKKPQVLVITPTRELAIQVAESFKAYAARMKDFHVLPVYGGQSYDVQLRQLTRGTHVIVGTPGRLMDHMKRGTLDVSGLSCLVLDEADEMLKMGFIDDVKWILEQTPADRQMALFSATMPSAIRAIAHQYLKDPEEVTIQVKTMTAETIHQRFWIVKGTDKLDALTRILEAEDFDAILVFVRTKIATIELAEKLEARGYATEALNGDIAQKSRERTIERFKSGKIDIVVATDVAARGLDVDRISHVINFDIPTEAESYIHRIGRTGRAGRKGEAILFVSPREMWMLKVIEKTTRQKIEMMKLPTTKAITNKRVADFKHRITDTLSSKELPRFRDLIEEYLLEQDTTSLDVAGALAIIANGGKPLFLPDTDDSFIEDDNYIKKDKQNQKPPKKATMEKRKKFETHESVEVVSRKKKKREENLIKAESTSSTNSPSTSSSSNLTIEEQMPLLSKGMERFRLDVGFLHGVKVGDIVGAIANEAGLESKFIKNIVIKDSFTIVDLPEGMPDAIFKILKKVRVVGQKLNITKV